MKSNLSKLLAVVALFASSLVSANDRPTVAPTTTRSSKQGSDTGGSTQTMVDRKEEIWTTMRQAKESDFDSDKTTRIAEYSTSNALIRITSTFGVPRILVKKSQTTSPASTSGRRRRQTMETVVISGANLPKDQKDPMMEQIKSIFKTELVNTYKMAGINIYPEHITIDSVEATQNGDISIKYVVEGTTGTAPVDGAQLKKQIDSAIQAKIAEGSYKTSFGEIADGDVKSDISSYSTGSSTGTSAANGSTPMAMGNPASSPSSNINNKTTIGQPPSSSSRPPHDVSKTDVHSAAHTSPAAQPKEGERTNAATDGAASTAAPTVSPQVTETPKIINISSTFTVKQVRIKKQAQGRKRRQAADETFVNGTTLPSDLNDPVYEQIKTIFRNELVSTYAKAGITLTPEQVNIQSVTAAKNGGVSISYIATGTAHQIPIDKAALKKSVDDAIAIKITEGEYNTSFGLTADGDIEMDIASFLGIDPAKVVKANSSNNSISKTTSGASQNGAVATAFALIMAAIVATF